MTAENTPLSTTEPAGTLDDIEAIHAKMYHQRKQLDRSVRKGKTIELQHWIRKAKGAPKLAERVAHIKALDPHVLSQVWFNQMLLKHPVLRPHANHFQPETSSESMNADAISLLKGCRVVRQALADCQAALLKIMGATPPQKQNILKQTKTSLPVNDEQDLSESSCGGKTSSDENAENDSSNSDSETDGDLNSLSELGDNRIACSDEESDDDEQVAALLKELAAQDPSISDDEEYSNASDSSTSLDSDDDEIDWSSSDDDSANVDMYDSDGELIPEHLQANPSRKRKSAIALAGDSDLDEQEASSPQEPPKKKKKKNRPGQAARKQRFLRHHPELDSKQKHPAPPPKLNLNNSFWTSKTPNIPKNRSLNHLQPKSGPEELHPSWEAKRRERERLEQLQRDAKRVKPQKVVFAEDD